MAYSRPFPLAKAEAQELKPTFGPDLAVRLICPECNDPNPNIVEQFSSGDLVCGNCGLVLGDRVVDTRSEWRTFANDEGDDPSRVGAVIDPAMDGLDQLSTNISFMDGGSGLARELQRAASRGQSSRSERNLLSAFKDIDNLCEHMSLPKTIRDIAKQLYKRSDEEKLLRGKPLDAVIAAAIFIACRQAKVPRTFREICNVTRVPKKTLGQCYKVLENAFLQTEEQNKGDTKRTGAADLVTRYCNHLNLEVRIETICRSIIETASEQGIAAGRSPVSIAGGAIFFATHLFGCPRTVKDIGSVAGVSEGTIKLVYKLYYADKHRLVKQEWLDSGKAKMESLPFEMTK